MMQSYPNISLSSLLSLLLILGSSRTVVNGFGLSTTVQQQQQSGTHESLRKHVILAAASTENTLEVATSADMDSVDKDVAILNESDGSEPSLAEPLVLLPGLEENELFDCDESVTFWRKFQRDGLWKAPENLQEVAKISALVVQEGGRSGLVYWLRHTGRSAYFATNAILGNLGFGLHERLVKGATPNSSGGILPLGMSTDVGSRLVLEAFLSYQQDFAQTQNGDYKEPWDMEATHRQSSPVNVLQQTSRFVDEAIGTLGRRNRGTQADKDTWITPRESVSTDLYPDYYRTAFHYQTDGWMSQKSANVYETSTETLFLGRQDAMQRISLKPLIDLSKQIQQQRKTDQGRPMRVLEIACGTGRFMTFVRDNLPSDTEYTAIDLSPYYLDAARGNDKYWRRFRKTTTNNNSSKPSPAATIVQAKAEELPFGDESFDAVVCVYLFHELPREIRARAASEMARVVRPGGKVVWTDSIQRGDRPILDKSIGNFGNMNEPYYNDYIVDNIPGHFQAAGLVPETKRVRSTTKSLSFSKPQSS